MGGISDAHVCMDRTGFGLAGGAAETIEGPEIGMVLSHHSVLHPDQTGQRIRNGARWR